MASLVEYSSSSNEDDEPTVQTVVDTFTHFTSNSPADIVNSKRTHNDAFIDEQAHDAAESDVEGFDFFNLDHQEIDTSENISRNQDEPPITYQPTPSYDDYANQFRSVDHQTSVIHSNSLNQSDISNIPEFHSLKRQNSAMNITHVNQQDLIGDTEQYASARAAIEESRRNKTVNAFQMSRASEGGRRSNNINFLAYQAQELEADLKERELLQRGLRKQSRKQYGF